MNHDLHEAWLWGMGQGCPGLLCLYYTALGLLSQASLSCVFTGTHEIHCQPLLSSYPHVAPTQTQQFSTTWENVLGNRHLA